MSTMELPTIMTAGVMQQVAFEPTESVVLPTEEVRISESVIARTEETKQSYIDVNKASSELSQISDADRLLNYAKEEGFEEALTHLAEGDFDEVAAEEQVLSEDIIDVEVIDEMAIEEMRLQESMEAWEKMSVIQRIDIMKQKVTGLEEKNKELFTTLQEVSNKAELSYDSLIGIAAVLYMMLEQEEDEDKELDLLTLLVAALESMNQFIKYILIEEGIIQPEKETNEPKNENRTAAKAALIGSTLGELMHGIGPQQLSRVQDSFDHGYELPQAA